MISKNDHSSGKLNLEDSLHQQREPKYIFIGFFTHGTYHEVSTKPYRENEHASKSIKTFRSTPKLMTFTNSSPGNIVLGEADGSDNTKITNYFKTNSDINFMTDTAKDQDKIIAESFLNYSKNGLATLAALFAPTKLVLVILFQINLFPQLIHPQMRQTWILGGYSFSTTIVVLNLVRA